MSTALDQVQEEFLEMVECWRQALAQRDRAIRERDEARDVACRLEEEIALLRSAASE